MHKRLADAPWIRALDYGEKFDDLLPFLQSLPPASHDVSQPQLTCPLDLREYRAAVIKYYARLKLEQLDPTTSDDRPRELTGMFVAQTARECTEFTSSALELPKDLLSRMRGSDDRARTDLDAHMPAEHRRMYLDQPQRSSLDILQSPSLAKLVILGDPGSGKSTLLQYVLLSWAREVAPDDSVHALSLLIELRDYVRVLQSGEVKDFLNYLSAGTSVRSGFKREHLESWLRHQPTLIMFDGLDEIFSGDLRAEIITSIRRFADRYPDCRIAVTSRVVGFQPWPWRDDHFRIFILEELDELQIADFLDRWHKSSCADDLQTDLKITSLSRAIEDSPAIRQLSGNPLLLTMMAILNRTQDLPRDRAELYSQCARLLLHHWKVDVAFSSYPELAHAALDFKDKRNLLLRVAGTMQANTNSLSANVIDEETLERTLSEGLRGIPNLRPDRAARALIEQLRGRNFMLCSLGGRSYAFVHRTFMEYFCALEILERFENKQTLTLEDLKSKIYANWTDEAWHETLCLLAGMLAPRFVGEIVTSLLEKTDEHWRYANVLLAGKCLCEVRPRNELGAAIQQTLRALQTVLHAWSYSHVFSSEVMINETIRAAALVIHARLQVGKSYATEWLVREIKRQPDGYGRATGVRELARVARNDNSVFEILRTFAQNQDEDRLTRKAAITELARGWRQEGKTRHTLESISIAPHEDSGVVATAVHELARTWKSDPALLGWIKRLLILQDNFAARRSALQVLSRYWKEDPDVLKSVHHSARSDENWTVRLAALQQLAQWWRQDAQTLPLLKSLATADSDERVRRGALQELNIGWRSDAAVAVMLQGNDRI